MVIENSKAEELRIQNSYSVLGIDRDALITKLGRPAARLLDIMVVELAHKNAHWTSADTIFSLRLFNEFAALYVAPSEAAARGTKLSRALTCPITELNQRHIKILRQAANPVALAVARAIAAAIGPRLPPSTVEATVPA